MATPVGLDGVSEPEWAQGEPPPDQLPEPEAPWDPPTRWCVVMWDPDKGWGSLKVMFVGPQSRCQTFRMNLASDNGPFAKKMRERYRGWLIDCRPYDETVGWTARKASLEEMTDEHLNTAFELAERRFGAALEHVQNVQNEMKRRQK